MKDKILTIEENLKEKEKELKIAKKEVYNAVWPNINDALDFKYMNDLKEEVRNLRLKLNNLKYTQRQWDRTVGYGKVPDEYNIEIENIALILRQRILKLQHENKVLRKMIYSLSRDTKEQIEKFIDIAIAVEKKDAP
jgi:hypothetical protein